MVLFKFKYEINNNNRGDTTTNSKFLSSRFCNEEPEIIIIKFL